MLQNEEFIQDFVDEARGHIDNIESGLINMNLLDPDYENVNDIFRAIHSIKGTASFFGLTKIVELAHSMENLFGELRTAKMMATAEMIDFLLTANDSLKTMINDVLNSEDTDISSYLAQLKVYLLGGSIAKPVASLDLLEKNSDEENGKEKDNGENICEGIHSEDIQCEEKDIEVHDQNKEKDIEVHDQNKEIKETGKKVGSNTGEDTVRVNVTLLNNLLNLASEMVLGRNQLLRAMEKHRKSIPGMDAILQNIDHITTEMQERIMQTRMQPIANVFNKFPRIIRDLSKKMNKNMDLKLEGVDVELDKSIIEALGDPLTHLVRNAADHGLESPEIREKEGKVRTGLILMKAYHEGGYVNIDIKDDGAGIRIENIKKKAVEKGFINQNDAMILGDQEILQLLFKPGFSTAETITDVSGRGVGMDVVKTNIERLGGTIEIFTIPSKGTTFRLLLPLTLAIIPSLIVEVEKQKFALPQVNLQEIVRIKPGDTTRKIEFINNAEVLRLRDRLLPIVHLADVLGLTRTYIDADTGETKEEKRKTLFDQRRKHEVSTSDDSLGNRRSDFANTIRILVIKIGSRKIGIAVDSIHGSEEILVKPLSRFIKDCKCYSGVTIMGDGKTALILDPDGIIEKANLRFFEGSTDKQDLDNMNLYEEEREKQNLLIFKSSGVETLAIDLSMVSRVEEICYSDIERIGDKSFIKFRGDSLKLIRPEDYLPISNEVFTKTRSASDKLFVIIPKLVRHSIGILIEKIHDTLQTGVKFNQEDIGAKGIIGSTILNNKIVLLVNIYELFEMADPEHYNVKSSLAIGEKRSILLVEDTPFFQKIEKSYLENSGYEVVIAQNGKEALHILQSRDFDAIVSDIQMPIMDGLELIKRIRADNRLSNYPVIAVTSMTGDLQKKAGLDAGFDYYEYKLDRVKMIEILDAAIMDRRKAI